MDNELQNLWTEGLKPEKRLEVIAAISKLNDVPVPASIQVTLKNCVETKAQSWWSFKFTQILVPALATLVLFVIIPRQAHKAASPIVNQPAIDEPIFDEIDSDRVVGSLQMQILDVDFPEELL